MRLKIIFLLVLFLPVFTFAQFGSTIDFIGSLEYSYRHLHLNTSHLAGTSTVLEKRENGESAKTNWRFGFNYNQRLANKFYLKTGIRWASMGYKGRKLDAIWASQHDGMGGFTPLPNGINETQFIWDYWFLEIPLVGRYEFASGRWTPFVEMGVSPSIYLTTRRNFVTNLGEEVALLKENNFNPLHLVGSISAGINYTLSDEWQLFGQPIFRYHLTPIEDTPIQQRLYSYGLEMGIRRKLK